MHAFFLLDLYQSVFMVAIVNEILKKSLFLTIITNVQESIAIYILILYLTNLLGFITSPNNFSFYNFGFSVRKSYLQMVFYLFLGTFSFAWYGFNIQVLGNVKYL